MDDANWITTSQENLQHNLAIADEFYIMTKAAINKNKSKLLTNNKNIPDNLTIIFGDTPIQISPNRTSVRFLGIWININNSPSFIIKQCRQIITSFINIVQHKPLTEMQLLYVINMVLYPLIMYRIQCTPFS